jgi:hypothetical protein
MPTTQTAGKSQTEHLDSTIEILEEHVKKESTTGVSATITAWIKTLQSHNELKPIAGDLEKLKEAISAKDGKKIVDLLTALGKETTKAAEQAEEPEAKKIGQLGKALSAAAKGVSKLVK